VTTIAFKDGIMAADSRCTDECGSFFTKTRKIDRLASGALLGKAGDTDAREVVALLSRATYRKLPSRRELAETRTEFNGILAFPNGRVFYVGIEKAGDGDASWTGEVIEVEERMCAVGSGYQFALGAMAGGKTAKQAVEIACRYDSYSQAPVRIVPLKPNP
jgi:ATP-dependent protease HslVU (ClpYQ), peptidase subunit